LVLTMAPALTLVGLNEMAVHLFCLYYGMLSYITPPVAFGAYVAASIAGADMMKTGVTAMKLGAVLFIVPFGFILSPALILQDASPWTILYQIASAFLGAWLVACSMGGYITGIGSIRWFQRLILFGSGLLLLLPGINLVWAGLIIAVVTIAVTAVFKKLSHKKATAPG